MSVVLIKPVATGRESSITTYNPHSELPDLRPTHPSHVATSSVSGYEQSSYSKINMSAAAQRLAGLQNGVALHVNSNQELVLNGVNINTCIETCQAYPTPKAKIFLKGMLARLKQALPHQNSASMQDAAAKLIELGSHLT